MIHIVCPNPAVDRTLLLNQLKPSIPNRPFKVRDYPGGKGFNVAYALQREDNITEILVHTLLGGENGQRVINLARKQGVNISYTEVNENTRECNIIIDLNNNLIYPIYEKGFELTEALLNQFTEKLISSISEGDTLVFSGSLMQGMPENYITKIKEALNDQAVTIIADTSGEPLRNVYYNKAAQIIKINDEEYNELFDIELTRVDEFAEHLKNEIDSFFEYFIVTMGEDGLLAKIGNEIIHYYAKPVEAKNPVASGDFFLGGLIRGILLDKPHNQIIKRSMAYSTSNVTHWFPYIDLNQIEEIINTIKIEHK